MTYTVVSLHRGFYFLKPPGFFMPFLCLARSALCGLTQLQSKMDWPRILSGAEHRATPGTLLKYTTACLIESPTMSRMTAISSGGPVAAEMWHSDADGIKQLYKCILWKVGFVSHYVWDSYKSWNIFNKIKQCDTKKIHLDTTKLLNFHLVSHFQGTKFKVNL